MSFIMGFTFYREGGRRENHAVCEVGTLSVDLGKPLEGVALEALTRLAAS